MDHQRTEIASAISRNVAIHDRIARKYDARHGEIFNEVEQRRLVDGLEWARNAVRTGADRIKALDFGCGSGNLTQHMVVLGMDVTSADVSRGFLDLVTHRFPVVNAVLINGEDMSNLQSCSFDFVATYSVLHHIPDYLAAVREMARVCKPGGVVVVDHEQNEEFWSNNPEYHEFRREAVRSDWRKYLVPMNYVHRLRRLINPRHTNEGDIHVWPDDHIEWSRIKSEMSNARFEVIREDDYLLFNRLYRREAYDKYVGRCTDMKMIVFRKCVG